MFVDGSISTTVPGTYTDMISDFCVESGQSVEIIAAFSGLGEENAVQILKDGVVVSQSVQIMPGATTA